MPATAVCEEQVQVRRERRPCLRPAAGITLGQLLARTHNAVLSAVEADCPVCGGTLVAHGLEGRCGDCGTRLS